MSSYTVKVGETSVRARSLQDAQRVVIEHITDLLARDPEAAVSAGTVAHALDTHVIGRRSSPSRSGGLRH